MQQNIFGSGAGIDQISKFGSLYAGSEEFTTDPALAQSLSNWLTGWFAAVINGNAPTIQDMNAVHFVVTYQLAYMQQRGIGEWISTVEYFTGSLVNEGGVLYTSLVDSNTNNAVTDPTKWRAYSSDAPGVGKDYWGVTLPAGYVWASGKTIGNASSNGTERANADTLDLFTVLWNAGTNTSLPIYTSAGVLSTRGASAAVDFAANKAIATPDKRGRASVGKDNLGGTAANRLTTGGSGIDGTVIGSGGGLQIVTLTQTEMPVHTHVDVGHNHGQIIDNATSAIYGETGAGPAGAGVFVSSATRKSTWFTATGAANNANSGSGGPHQNTQPSIVCNYIIKL